MQGRLVPVLDAFDCGDLEPIHAVYVGRPDRLVVDDRHHAHRDRIGGRVHRERAASRIDLAIDSSPIDLGLIQGFTSAVTDVAGSSAWFDCGMAVYSYEAKQAMLGVNPHTLEIHGAVSRETVVEMVSGALVHSGATIAVAVTGIAGPGGGTEDKPVGTVWVAWKRRGGYPRAEIFHFDGDRDAVRRQTVAAALQGLLSLAG